MPSTLRIDMSQTFGYPLALEVTGWSEGVSWINEVQQQRFINAYDEDNGLSLAWLFNQPDNQAWQKDFPPDILQALLDFEQRFSRHTFSSLWFVSRCEAARQLLLSAPILMWMLMDYAKKHRLAPEQVLPLFSIKRTDILALHGLPSTKSTLNLLYKYLTDDFNHEDIRLLNELGQRFEARLLGRFNQINRSMVIWLLEQPSMLNYPFFHQLCDADIRAVRTTFRDTVAMGAELNRQRTEHQLQNCHNLEQLYALHDGLVEQFNRHQINTQKNTIYPTCPFEESDAIIQVKTAYELMQEGTEMAHCVASYHKRVLNGEYFVFKVFAPERATLGLHFVRGQLRIDQLRLKRNATPSKETQEAVFWWLENQSQ
ncbi:MAG: PcfJ domain-containing protein [Thiomicrospira sp.]